MVYSFDKSKITFGLTQLDYDFSFKTNDLLLLKEDINSINHLLFLKIFKCNNQSFDTFSDDNDKFLVPEIFSNNNKNNNTGCNNNLDYDELEMRNSILESEISWRYSNKNNDNVFKEKKYDLTKIKEVVKTKSTKKFFKNEKIFSNDIINYSNCDLSNVDTLLNDFNIDNQNSRGYIFISLFSPTFLEHFIDTKKFNDVTYVSEFFIKKLFELRRFCKMNNKFVIATIPCYLYERYNVNFDLYFDYTFQFGSFMNYSGTLIQMKNGHLNYGFKINSKGIEIEHLNLTLIEDDRDLNNNKGSLNDF